MSIILSTLANSYRLAHFRRQAANWLWGNTLVLVYHRIAKVPSDPLSVCVSPDNFASHLEFLQSLGSIVPARKIEEHLSRSLRGGLNFVLTFDDGYADNFDVALPLLRYHNAPATFFIIANSFTNRLVYSGDVLQEVLLNTEELPPRFSFQANGSAYFVDLAKDWRFTQEARQNWCAWKLAREAPTRRHFWLKNFRSVLMQMRVAERSEFLRAFVCAAGCEAILQSNPSVTAEMATAAVRDERYEIGSHTLNHPRLSNLSNDQQRQEIAASKQKLEILIEKPVESFAFPHGGPEDYRPETVRLIMEAGYRRAFICRPSCLNWRIQALEIPRLNVGDWDRRAFRNALLGTINRIPSGQRL